MENGEVHPSEEGTPQGGSVSVLLSNVYLHYVLDLWFERVVKPRLRGEACMVRYIDDFVLCFQFRSDALRAQEALAKRLRKFSLTLEPMKTKLVEFGRFAHRHASKRGRKRPQTIYFLGFTMLELFSVLSDHFDAPKDSPADQSPFVRFLRDALHRPPDA